MNLSQLRVFYVAAREQSHTRAARTLFITQPAVSQNIKNLETYLGLPLFRRNGRERELTPAGAALFDYAERIFRVADEAERAMRELGAIDRGKVRVGTSKIYARYLMPSIIDAYRKRHPDITVVLDEGSSEQMVRSVVDLTNQVAVVGRVDYPARVRHQHYRWVQLVLVTGADHPLALRAAGGESISWRDLADQPVILREQGSSARLAATERFALEGVTPLVAMESGSVDFIKRYVAEGKAVAFLWEPDIRAELKAGRLVRVPLTEGELELETSVVLLPDVSRTPAVRAFLQVLEESAAAGWSAAPEDLLDKNGSQVASYEPANGTNDTEPTTTAP